MNLGIYIRTWLLGEKVGEDSFGNRYFQEKKHSHKKKPRRWVLYKGKAEASKIPPLWYGWLHYTFDTSFIEKESHLFEKDHLPNLTGTEYAAHFQSPSKEKKVYESWEPPNC